MPPTLLDPALTLHEIVDRWPITLGVLREHGLDACRCAGSLPLAEAARRHDVDPVALRVAMERAIVSFDAAVEAAVNKFDIA